MVAARARQRERYGEEGFATNATLSPRQLRVHGATDARGARLLARAAERMALTARAYDRVRKVARTIADLAGDRRVGADHIAEALQFRMG